MADLPAETSTGVPSQDEDRPDLALIQLRRVRDAARERGEARLTGRPGRSARSRTEQRVEELKGRRRRDRKSTRLNSSHSGESRMPSSA